MSQILKTVSVFGHAFLRSLGMDRVSKALPYSGGCLRAAGVCWGRHVHVPRPFRIAFIACCGGALRQQHSVHSPRAWVGDVTPGSVTSRPGPQPPSTPTCGSPPEGKRHWPPCGAGACLYTWPARGGASRRRDVLTSGWRRAGRGRRRRALRYLSRLLVVILLGCFVCVLVEDADIF